MNPPVLDTSALLTLFNDEPGAEAVSEILADGSGPSMPQSPRAYLPFMALMELEYMVLRHRGPLEAETALRMIYAWRAEVVESDREWRRAAARVKARAGLSVADAWMAALALRVDAELVHKDPEFDRVEGLRHRRLPYKGG